MANAGTFSTGTLATIPNNGIITLTQQVLVGTSISFTPPNTINLQPGNYIANYSLMGNPDATGSDTTVVGLRLNGSNITQSFVGNSLFGLDYPQAVGSYLLTISANSTLQLICRFVLVYLTPVIDNSLAANNTQIAQLTIFKL